MAQQPGKVVRMYSINEEKLDEAIQAWVDFILDVASEDKLASIKEQLEARLKASKA